MKNRNYGPKLLIDTSPIDIQITNKIQIWEKQIKLIIANTAHLLKGQIQSTRCWEALGQQVLLLTQMEGER
jgi:hypothetical protein